jgi:LPS sulfotransferase NodH
MATPASYILCGTPRTGSTLLCSLLSSTGVLGHPESYFREPDEVRWAGQFRLPTAGGRTLDHRAFVTKAREAGSTPNGVFGARIMWGSLDRLVTGIGNAGGSSDLAVLEEGLGPLVFVHLRRDGLLEQAVSWSRAEQTGFWQQGDEASCPPQFDVGRLKGLLSEIRAHNAAWQSWFQAQAIEPLVLTYEEIVTDPRAAVFGIAGHLSVKLPRSWRPRSEHRKQADDINSAHVTALREALGAEGP